MIKLSTSVLLFLIVLSAILGVVSYTMIDWTEFHSGTLGMLKELRLSLIFWACGIYFVFPYVKKLKEDKSTK